MSAEAEAFWRQVEVSSETACWRWLGYINRDGYGHVSKSKFGTQWAHRAAYELRNGPIPDDHHIDHLCRNRACVNPAHLEAVTQRVNTLRGEGPTARNARAAHCPKGHPYDETNTIHRAEGSRACRTCVNARDAARRKKLRECQSCQQLVPVPNWARHTKSQRHQRRLSNV